MWPSQHTKKAEQSFLKLHFCKKNYLFAKDTKIAKRGGKLKLGLSSRQICPQICQIFFCRGNKSQRSRQIKMSPVRRALRKRHRRGTDIAKVAIRKVPLLFHTSMTLPLCPVAATFTSQLYGITAWRISIMSFPSSLTPHPPLSATHPHG